MRDLLAACGRSRDRNERSQLLARVATELELAAAEIRAADRHRSHGEVAAGLRGQAGMARLLADLDAPPEARPTAAS